MSEEHTRRGFLRTAATAGTALGLTDLAALWQLGPASAAEAQVTTDLVRFGPELEPVVRLIEQTPEDLCVAAMVEQLRKGLPYRHFLAALYLATIRAARWNAGQVHGYDHNAYVVHSAHQLALDLPAGEQLLPAFYALTNFKVMQKVYPNRKGTPELTGKLPVAEKASDEFHAAMAEWDAERAERAIVALARSRSRPEVLEPLWHYAGRDWAFIGHLAILVANSCRLLETIGWQHAEHVLRYVVQGLAGWGKERAEHGEVKPYRANLPRANRAARRLNGGWARGGPDDGLTKELLTLLREAKGDEACELAASRLTNGKAAAGAVWDAVHLAAGELVLSAKLKAGNRPDGNALHAATAANALHYAFRASAVPETQLLLMLQALAWMDLFRQTRAKNLVMTDITALTGVPLPDKAVAAIDEILATRTDKPHEAGQLAFAFARDFPVESLLRAARRLLPVKASGDPHDFKFPVAIFEDIELVSPDWRPHLLAAAVFSFWGTDRPDNPVMEQVRDAVRTL